MYGAFAFPFTFPKFSFSSMMMMTCLSVAGGVIALPVLLQSVPAAKSVPPVLLADDVLVAPLLEVFPVLPVAPVLVLVTVPLVVVAPVVPV